MEGMEDILVLQVHSLLEHRYLYIVEEKEVVVLTVADGMVGEKAVLTVLPEEELGGGATHIALKSGVLSSLNMSTVLLVGGGGGGGGAASPTRYS